MQALMRGVQVLSLVARGNAGRIEGQGGFRRRIKDRGRLLGRCRLRGRLGEHFGEAGGDGWCGFCLLDYGGATPTRNCFLMGRMQKEVLDTPIGEGDLQRNVAGEGLVTMLDMSLKFPL